MTDTPAPQTALAEALARTESQAPDDANEAERAEWRDKADRILAALSERGYTIVASDRSEAAEKGARG